MTESSKPAASGYRPPAVSIRATYTVGDVADELVVDIDQWGGDVAVITRVIDALTERKPNADVQVDAPAEFEQGQARVYDLPRASNASEEAQA
jgi:hypothetical protein